MSKEIKTPLQINSVEYKNHNIKIYYDDKSSNNPALSKLNKGIIVYLPYIENILKITPGNMVLTEESIEKIQNNQEYISLPICLVEIDNRFALTTNKINCSSPYGIIYNTKENLLCYYPNDTENNAKKVFEKEVNLLSDFIEGKVYGYEIYNDKNSLVESCWGYIGVEESEIIEEAEEIIDKVYS